MDTPAPKFDRIQKAFAWGVHGFTALGIVVGLLALIAVSEREWRLAFLWLFAALVIDGIDGTLARQARVAEVLPEVNGKMIDAIIDFTTYAIVPAYFFFQADLAPPGWSLLCAAVMLMASVLYYGKEGMIADSMHFVGFPVLWNVFVFFIFFVFRFPDWVNALLVGVFAILHFVPVKYAYPSRATRWRTVTWIVSLAGMLAALGLIWSYPGASIWLRAITVVAALYFIVLAIRDTFFG